MLALIAVGYGVHRRSLAAVRVGMGLFGLVTAALVVLAIVGYEGNRASLIPAVLTAWVVSKLHTVAQVLEGRSPAPSS